MGSIDIPPFVREKMKQQVQKTPDSGVSIDIPDFIKKKESGITEPPPTSGQPTLPSVPQSKSVESNPPIKPLLNTQQAAEKFGLTPIQDLQNQNVSKSDNTLSVPNAGVFNKQVNAFNEVTDKTITGNAPDESVVIRNEYQKKRKGILNPEVVIPASQLTPENNFGLNTNLNAPQVVDNAVNKIQVKPVQVAPVNAVAPPTPEQEFKQKVSDNLSSLEKETIAKSGEYAMKVTSDPVAAGFITKAILGDNMAISQKRSIDKGGRVSQADLYQTGQVGIASMIAGLDKKYESDPQNPDYISKRLDLENQATNLIDKFPEYKTSQLTKAVSIELGKLHPEVSNNAAMARLYLPEIKKEMGLSDEDVKAIDFDNYPTSNFLTSLIAPIYKGALGLGLSATRVIGSAVGMDKDLLNSSLAEAAQSPIFFDDIETIQNTGQTIDTQKGSRTFLQNIADPNKGKYNYTFHNILNSVGHGAGTLVWFALGTKGAGAVANKAVGALGAAIEPEVAGAMAAASKGETLTLSEINALNKVNQGINGAVTVNGLPFKLSADVTNEVGMAGLMMGQGYEDYYQKARTVISDKPEDEWKRHTFSLINGALDYLGFRVLGNVVKGLPPAAEKEIGQVFKDAPNLAAVNKKALQSKLTDILKGTGEAAKETAFVGSATTASEIAKAVVVNVMGNDEAAKEENAQLPSVIEGSIASLPFSMFIPILGSKIIAGGQSKVHKENIYNAGISPENYKGDAHKLFDMGAINQEQLNDRIQVINTAANIVKSIPSDVFDNLNHNQRVTYVNSKIRESALKAKSDGVQDEALAAYYADQIKGEVSKRSDVLNGGGKEGEFPESVSVIKPKTKEEINNQIPTVTIAPKENTPETKQGVSVVLPQTVERGREMPTITIDGKTNENATEKTAEVPKPTEAASTTNEAANKVEQPTEESLVSQAKDLVNSGVVKGYTAETLKESANNNPAEFQQHLKDISEQANDPKSNKATVDTYGKELVDIAQELNKSNDNTNATDRATGMEAQQSKLGNGDGERDLQNKPDLSIGSKSASSEVAAENKTSEKGQPISTTGATVLNEQWRNLKDKQGEKKAKKIYDNAIRLINPNENNIVEIRYAGVVTKEGNKHIFHPFLDTDLKNWRLGKPRDISDQFQAATTPTEVNKPISVNEGEPVKTPKEKPISKPISEVKGDSLDKINEEAKSIAEGVRKRKENVIKHYQYDLKTQFLKEHKLPEKTIDTAGFNKLWNGVLADSNDLSLSDIAPNRIKDALKNPDAYKKVYDEAYDKFAGKSNIIKDTQAAKDFILSNLPPEKESSKPTNTKESNFSKKLKDKYKDFNLGGTKDADLSGSGRREITLPDGTKETVKPVAPEIVNGFYSPIEKKILATKDKSLSANKWRERFGKGDEAKFTGILDFLNSKKPNEQVPKQEVLDYIKNNRIQLVEVVKGDKEFSKEKAVRAYKDYIEQLNQKYNTPVWYELATKEEREKLHSLEKEADASLNGRRPTRGESEVKFSDYQLPGEKENYKEVLITMPTKEDAVKDVYANKFFGKDYNELSGEDKSFIDSVNPSSGASVSTKFKSSHFDEPNIIAHLRMSTRTDAEGNKVLFVDEIQSDFGQSYKKAQTEISDYLDKNENKVIEAFKKKGLLKIVCP